MIEPDPNATFRVALTQHQQMPPDVQPRFEFRVLKRRQTKTLVALLTRLQAVTVDTDPKEGLAVMDGIEAFIKSVLIGWENQIDETGAPLPFDVADLDRVIDEADMIELALAIPKQSQVTAGERKKSAWQSRSSSAPPASTVPQASPAAAGTSQATAIL